MRRCIADLWEDRPDDPSTGSGRGLTHTVRQETRDLATTLIAFANADGGRLLIGIEDDGTVRAWIPSLTGSRSSGCCCGYCRGPQKYVLGPLEIDHIVPIAVMVRHQWVEAGWHPPENG